MSCLFAKIVFSAIEQSQNVIFNIKIQFVTNIKSSRFFSINKVAQKSANAKKAKFAHSITFRTSKSRAIKQNKNKISGIASKCICSTQNLRSYIS